MSASAGLESVRCVCFDAAGTLLHPHPSVGDVYQQVARAHGSDCSVAALNAGFRSAFRSAVKRTDITDPEARERDFWRQVVSKSLEHAGARVAHFEPLFDDLWEAFAHANRWRVNEGTVPTLRALRTRGYRLAVISNWDRRLHSVLRESELRDYFAAVIISSEAGHEKPEPGIFRSAEQALGATAQECLHIGDSPREDLAGARAAGWHAMLLRHDDSQPTEDSLGHVGQLPALLRATAPGTRRGSTCDL